MPDVDGVLRAVGEFGDVAGRVEQVEGAFDGGGEEVVPVGIGVREPARGGVLQDELEGGAVLAPGVEVEDVG